MTSDLVVELHAGTYFLTRPFQLLAAEGDSGRNGHRVVYQAHGYGTPAQAHVVISGGRRIRDWVEHDPATGIWRAGVGDLDTRQLFVDGRRAERARLQGPVPGALTRTETGYVTDSTAPQAWRSPADVEFVYQGVYPWSEARCGVAEISGDDRSTTITMAQPAFGWAARLYQGRIDWEADPSAWPEGAEEWQDGGGIELPTSVENSPSFLTEPGTFALDRSRPGAHVLYYLPRAGEDLRTASVVAPALEALVVGRGAAGNPLRDVSVRGLEFAHATWLRPSRPEGFLHYFGGTYYDGGPLETVTFADGQGSVTVPGGEPAAVPANVRFETSTGVIVEGNRFTALGANALQLCGGCCDNIVRGNVFDDISGSAVTIGGGTGRETGAAGGPDSGNIVADNWVHDIGRDYHGSPAIALSGTRDTTVAHNQINDVPYSGIVIGGGDTARGAQVIGNLIYNTMQVLADGGGIYLAGNQGASFASGAVVRGNVVRDTITSYNFGVYTDYGATWVTVQGNVVARSDTPVVLRVSPPLEHVAFVGNFWDDDPDGWDDPPKGVAVVGNARLPRESFEQALRADPAGADILANAGLEPGYRGLLDTGR
jgi:hypothetical protein